MPCPTIAIPPNRIIGLVNRTPITNLPQELENYPTFTTFEEALCLKPNLVSIATHIGTHAPYAIAALEAGAHVFVEKPLAPTVAESEQVITTARKCGRKLVVGYILRHHPSWQKFVTLARNLGPPYVFRMNLNQQSKGAAWEVHKKIIESGSSPVVDCGVHYLDVMLQITDSRLVQNGSVGWYEAGWGPMTSETAHFVKDVVGPKGSVSIVGEEGSSADVDGHTKISKIKIHGLQGGDEVLKMEQEPGHQALCDLEQQFVADVIREQRDLERHWRDAVRSQAVVLAADLSLRESRAVDL